MSDPEIRHERGETRGRYVIETEHGEAELTYSILGPRQRIAEHTGVPTAARGRGLGRALVERLVADARRDGFRVVPLCPFVKTLLGRNDDWLDVFKT